MTDTISAQEAAALLTECIAHAKEMPSYVGWIETPVRVDCLEAILAAYDAQREALAALANSPLPPAPTGEKID